VITITAYTEPIPPPTPSPQINETPIVDENEDDEEQLNFAEILAGLLRKNETVEKPELTQDSFENIGIDALADFSGMEQTDNLFAADGETGEILEKTNSDTVVPSDDVSQTELYGEYQQVLLSADRLFTRIEPQVTQDVYETEAETSVKIPENFLTETELYGDFSSFTAIETEGTGFASETYASVKTAEDSPFSRIEDKKNKVSFKDEKNPFDTKEKITEEPYLSAKKNEAPGRLEETRSRLRKDKVSFEVRDLRTSGANESSGTRSYSAVEASAGRSSGANPVREITLELRLPDQNNSPAQTSPQTTWEVKAESALENMLARELHQNFNGDIVRHASMALRDGGEGTIKIALKPESLGNVKIRLEMTENKVTGHIVVESEEALNAFRKEISSLEQAFRDSGFTNADLNLSLSAEGRNAQDWEQEESSFARNMVSSRYDSSFEQNTATVDVYFGRSGLINMLA